MPFTVHKRNFFDCIQKAFPLVSSKTSMPMLLNFKLSFHPDYCEVAATDLEHSIRVRTGVIGSGDAEITVNAKKLFEIVKELFDDDLTIDFQENVLCITSGSSFSCKIAGVDSRDYPAFPEINESVVIAFPIHHLIEMTQKSSFAVSKDESRACLCGVFWEMNTERTGMVATDGHRLGSSFYIGNYIKNSLSSIISPKTLNHLSRICDSEGNEPLIQIIFDEKYILFKNSVFSLCSKLIEGAYPDYDKVIPKNNPRNAVVDRALLFDAVRRVSVLANQKTHLVKFVFRSNDLEVIVMNRDIGGEARQIIPIEFNAPEEFIIGFNAAYLLEILGIIKSSAVRIEMNTQISACLLFPVFKKEEEKESDDLFLIMPLRILDEL